MGRQNSAALPAGVTEEFVSTSRSLRQRTLPSFRVFILLALSPSAISRRDKATSTSLHWLPTSYPSPS
jgi:hypothetical protein